MLVSFFTSHYLNLITESHQRATVLSFKGMAFNLAYGLIGFLFALLITRLREGGSAAHPHWYRPRSRRFGLSGGASAGFPGTPSTGLGLTIIYCSYRLRGTGEYRKTRAEGPLPLTDEESGFSGEELPLQFQGDQI